MSRWFWIKATLGALGLAATLAGMALDEDLLLIPAGALLGAALVVRFVQSREASRQS
jgi:hypothetical protein